MRREARRSWRGSGPLRWCGAWLLSVTIFTAPLAAQTETADSARNRREPLFVRADALYAGGFLLGTLAMYPIDLEVADALRDPSRQANELLGGTASGFRLLGFPGTLLIGTAMYAGGRLGDRSDLADAGLHTTESLVLALAATGALKSLVGRARPDEVPDDPHQFELGRGLGGDRYQSFPSGHTSLAFAAASSLSTELGRIHPGTRAWTRPLLYGGASLVGISRTYNNKHWASDVVAGAAIGTFSGWKVVRYAHTHPNNRLDRIFLNARIFPLPGGGMAAAWSF